MLLRSLWKFSLFIAAFGYLIGGSASAQELFEHGLADEGVPFAPGGPIPGQYIVILNDDVINPRGVAAELSRAHGLGLGFTYSHAIKGFSAQVPAQALAALSLDPRVAYIEENQRAFLVGHHSVNAPTGIRRTFADENAQVTIDGHDDLRIDVDVAVIDSGIDLDHPNLNVVSSVACLHRGGGFFGPVNCTEGAGNDGYWHGSHVAGTIGALDNGQNLSGCSICDPTDGLDVVGIAPGARLHAVKVFNDSGSGGTTDTVMAGIEWVAARADIIEVANMSLGFEINSPAVCQSIANATAMGVTFAVAAGNGGPDGIGDPVSGSPADCVDVNPDMFVVSALADHDGEPGGLDPTAYCSQSSGDPDDTLADFSNFGDQVNITAPGTCIVSTYANGGYGIASGTSMSSPHVAGAAALLASGGPCDTTPIATELPCAPTDGSGVALIVGELSNAGNLNWTDNSGDWTHEPLLDVSGAVFAPVTVAGSEGSGLSDPPIAGFISSCTGLSCDFTDQSTDDVSVATWSWNFGDGGSSTEQDPSHTYSADGTYTVTLTVTDDDLQSDSIAQNITVSSGGGLSDPPTASFGSVCTNLSCNFTDLSTDDVGVATWSWNFGDGGSSTAQNPSHTYSADGTYNVTLTVTDDDDQSDGITQSVTVSSGASGTPDACDGLSDGIHFITSSTSQGSTWTAIVDAVNCSGQDEAPFTGSGSWNPDLGGSGCVTSSTGVCQASQSGIRKRTGSVQFTIEQQTTTVLKP